jgi:hypothetical protein
LAIGGSPRWTWDREAIELLGPAVLRFDAAGTGRIRFIAVEGLIDWRGTGGADGGRVEFTWEGFDEGDPVSGRGWVEAVADGLLRGRIFFHLGDDSGFRASAGM